MRAQVEVYQRAERVDEATACLERLQTLAPEETVVRLSPVEFLGDTHPHDRETAARIVKLTAGVENATPVHAALLLYKARARKEFEAIYAEVPSVEDAPEGLLDGRRESG